MIGVDTNILVRFFVRDNEKLFKRAERFLLITCTRTNPGYVNLVVLVELVKVLTAGYGVRSDRLARLIGQLLVAERLVLENAELVRAALTDFEDSKADFEDCLIGQLNRHAKCQTTMTLDKKASRGDAFALLS